MKIWATVISRPCSLVRSLRIKSSAVDRQDDDTPPSSTAEASKAQNPARRLHTGRARSGRPSAVRALRRCGHVSRASGDAAVEYRERVYRGCSRAAGRLARSGRSWGDARNEKTTWRAELAKGEGPGRIYVVERTGAFMDDPNLTDKKFPGNPTKSHRSREPLRVVGEYLDWQGHSPRTPRRPSRAIRSAHGLPSVACLGLTRVATAGAEMSHL